MNGRHTGHILENMRQMVRRHGKRLPDVLQGQLFGEMRADVLPNTIRQHQIMRLIGGALIGRQIGRQQHQRRQQVGYQFIRIGTVTLRVAVNQLAERLNMVDLVRRRPHKAMFRVGKMTLRQPAEPQIG